MDAGSAAQAAVGPPDPRVVSTSRPGDDPLGQPQPGVGNGRGGQPRATLERWLHARARPVIVAVMTVLTVVFTLVVYLADRATLGLSLIHI